MCRRGGCSKKNNCGCNRKRNCDCEHVESCAEICGKNCCKPIKVAFIDQMNQGGTSRLEDTVTKIQEAFAKRLFPSIKEIDISYIVELASDYSNLNTVMADLENRVLILKAQGFEYIVLPLSSSVLNPFIDPLNPLNASLPPNILTLDIMERHPTVTFVELNVGTGIVRTVPIPNVWKFNDSVTGGSTAIIQQNIQTWVTGGDVLIIGINGSVVSQNLVTSYTAAANALSIANSSFHFSLPIDAPQVAGLITVINNLPVGSAVLIATDGSFTTMDAFTQEFFINQWGSLSAQSQAFVYAGINYQPINVFAPVNIQQPFNGTPNLWPSKFLIQQLGWPSTLADIATFLPNFLYIEAMAFFARCGKSYTGTDGLSKFDAFHELIFPYVSNGVVPAGTNVYTNLTIEENPRWTSASYHLQSNVCYT